MRMLFHAANRASERLGDRCLGKIREISQDDDIALASGKPTKQPDEFHPIMRILIHRADLPHRHARTPGATTPDADRQIGRCRRRPRLGVTSDAAPPNQRSGQGFLRHILGVTLIAKNAKRHSVRDGRQRREGGSKVVRRRSHCSSNALAPPKVDITIKFPAAAAQLAD
jgi:hypothetical protein